MSRHDAEPCTITAQGIAAFLEQHGRPRSADFVRWLAGAEQRTHAKVSELRGDYAAILERLHRYEPPAERVVVDYTPPPEASD